MTPPLTQVPATLPGVVRRGTSLVTVEPVFVGGIACAAGMQCVSGGPPDSAGQVLALCALGSIVLPLSWLAVDLDDATGRAHAAGAAVGCPVALWCPWDHHRRQWDLIARSDDSVLDRSWEGLGPEQRAMRLSGEPTYGWDSIDCPALDDLDPNDPALLSDGSRWVDAEALARVLLHVLGGER